MIRRDVMRIPKGNPLLGRPYLLAAYHAGVYTPREIAKFCRFGLRGLVGLSPRLAIPAGPTKVLEFVCFLMPCKTQNPG